MEKILKILADHPWLIFVLWFGGSGVGAGGSYLATTNAIETQLQTVTHRVEYVENALSHQQGEVDRVKEDVRSLEIQMTRIEGAQNVTNEKLSGIERVLYRLESRYD